MSKNTRNRVLLGVSAILLVCLSVGATLAFLTDTTGTVTNTFSVGNVSFLGNGLDESRVNEYGVPLNADGKTEAEVKAEDPDAEFVAERVTKNTYKIIPGHKYTKDPTIHINANSEEAYVFFSISRTSLVWSDINNTHYLSTQDAAETINAQIETNGWDSLSKPDPDNPDESEKILQTAEGHLVFYYKTKVVAGGTAVDGSTFPETGIIDLPIFESFKIRTGVTDADIPSSAKLADLQIIIKAYAVQADGFDSPLAAWEANFAPTSGGN